MVTNTFVNGKNKQVQITLNMVWNIATCVEGSLNKVAIKPDIKFFQISKIIKNIIEPTTLNIK